MSTDQNPEKSLNRFGKDASTDLPEDAPRAGHSGHKLRTANVIVDRKALAEKAALNTLQDSKQISKWKDQEIELIEFDDQVGLIRKSQEAPQKSIDLPNSFTGPSFRNKAERFRFDGHKMMHHLNSVMSWQKGEKFSPIHIDMGLTKFCNTACLYCYAVVQNMTKGTMIEREALLRYIEDCGRLGVRSIGFNPAVYDAAVLAKKVNVETSMATNGVLLDMDRAHDFLRDMSWIRFNLSAGDRDSFKLVHQSAPQNFDLLVEKIRTLVKIKKENGYQCTLGLQMVLIPECFDQVLNESKLGAELGVDYFVIKHCSDSEYKELGINYQNYLNLDKVLKEAEALSNENYVVQVKWNKIMAAGESALYKNGFRKYDICHGTPFLLQISGNGKIYPCGPFFNKERFYIGNIHENSFYDIVMSERYWNVHADIAKSVDVHKDCAIGCRQDYINKFLWDLENPPEHINFI